MNTKAIMVETEELTVSLSRLIVETVKAKLDDGKISIFEASQLLLQNSIPIYKGIEGIVKVPSETAQANADDVDHLLFALEKELLPIFGIKGKAIAIAMHKMAIAFIESVELVREAYHPN